MKTKSILIALSTTITLLVGTTFLSGCSTTQTAKHASAQNCGCEKCAAKTEAKDAKCGCDHKGEDSKSHTCAECESCKVTKAN